MFLIDGVARRLRLVLTATTFLLGVLVGLGVIVAARPARADQDVVLKTKASPELMAFARHYFLHEWDGRDAFIYDQGREPDPARVVDETIEKGEADLNGDGVPERIFMFTGSGDCGSGGCETLILQKQGARWHVIMEDGAFGIRILDKTDSGYHRLCTGFLMEWFGDHYDEVEVGTDRKMLDPDAHDYEIRRCDP